MLPSRLHSCYSVTDKPIPVATTQIRSSSKARTVYTGQTLIRTNQPNNNLVSMHAIASTAKAKLSTELDCPNPQLRTLVGHANLLDALMEELIEVERKREGFFKATNSKVPAVHVRWIDQIPEDDLSDDIDDDNSDVSDEDADLAELVLQRSREQA